jgi:hypothetical protein
VHRSYAPVSGRLAPPVRGARRGLLTAGLLTLVAYGWAALDATASRRGRATRRHTATLSAVPHPTRLRVPRRVGRPVAVGLAAATAAAFTVVVAARGGAPFAADLAVRDAVAAYDHGWPRRIAAVLTLLGTGRVRYPVGRPAEAGDRLVRRAGGELSVRGTRPGHDGAGAAAAGDGPHRAAEVLIEQLQGLTAVAAVVLLPAPVGVGWPWWRAGSGSSEGTGPVERAAGGALRT